MLNKEKVKKIYFAGVCLGLLLGVFIYCIQPLRWEAVALVKLGQIHQPLMLISKNSQMGVEFGNIESIPFVIERLMSNSFRIAAIDRVKGAGGAALLEVDKCDCLSIKPLKNDEGLILKLVGSNPELVSQSVMAVYEELKYQHKLLLNNFITSFKKSSLVEESEIENISKTIALIDKSIKTKNHADDASLTKLILNMELNRELVAKRGILSEHKLFIENFENIETQLVGSVSVKEKLIFPSLWRTSLLSMLFGLFLSIVWVRWKR